MFRSIPSARLIRSYFLQRCRCSLENAAASVGEFLGGVNYFFKEGRELAAALWALRLLPPSSLLASGRNKSALRLADTRFPLLFFRGVGRVGAKPKDMYLHENRRKIDCKVAKKKKATSCQNCHRFRPLRYFSQKSLGWNDEEIGATRSPFVLFSCKRTPFPHFSPPEKSSIAS